MKTGEDMPKTSGMTVIEDKTYSLSVSCSANAGGLELSRPDITEWQYEPPTPARLLAVSLIMGFQEMMEQGAPRPGEAQATGDPCTIEIHTGENGIVWMHCPRLTAARGKTLTPSERATLETIVRGAANFEAYGLEMGNTLIRSDSRDAIAMVTRAPDGTSVTSRLSQELIDGDPVRLAAHMQAKGLDIPPTKAAVDGLHRTVHNMKKLMERKK
jgi:hypothetical protein